ncbi:MAG: hypothetical protein ABSC91_01435 [Candidatus Bathyarchaeia archaeon]
MKKDVVSVGTALVLTLIVFAGFATVMALIDYNYNYSPDGTAYAQASGAYSYNPPSNGYYNQEHEASITEGNVWRSAWCEFLAYYKDRAVAYASPYSLANNTGVRGLAGYSGIYAIETYTDSGYSASPPLSQVDVQIGPPGSQ